MAEHGPLRSLLVREELAKRKLFEEHQRAYFWMKQQAGVGWQPDLNSSYTDLHDGKMPPCCQPFLVQFSVPVAVFAPGVTHS